MDSDPGPAARRPRRDSGVRCYRCDRVRGRTARVRARRRLGARGGEGKGRFVSHRAGPRRARSGQDSSGRVFGAAETNRRWSGAAVTRTRGLLATRGRLG